MRVKIDTGIWTPFDLETNNISHVVDCQNCVNKGLFKTASLV